MPLLKYQNRLRLKKKGATHFVFDPIRKKDIVLTPEEIVRQLVIYYLIEEQHIPLGRISVEKQIKLYDTTKRYDLLVFDKNANPYLLVECKRPEISLDDKVLDQIQRYNIPLQVPYLMITNGQEVFFLQFDKANQSYRNMDEWHHH